MEHQYDENISQNIFFKQLQKEHKIILERAPVHNWIICIPKANCFRINHKYTNRSFTENGADNVAKSENHIDEDIIMSHVLIPNDELPGTHFFNLNNNEIVLTDNKSLRLRTTDTIIETIILFEEVFYTKELLKYKIWCIDTLLYPITNINCDSIILNIYNNKIKFIRSHNDAITFLLNESNSKKRMLLKFDSAIQNFLKNNQSPMNLDKIKNNTYLLYNHCIDISLMYNNLNEKCKSDIYLLKNLKLSIEIYVMNNIYKHLFNLITLCCLEESSNFNRLLRNLADISSNELKLNATNNEMIVHMKMELIKIETYTTAMDKLNCLHRALDSTMYKTSKLMTIDDLIPVLVFVIIKCGLTHWITNLLFLKNFLLSIDINNQFNNFEFGQENFLITTLEAAILYIKSDNIKRNYLIKYDNDDIFLNNLFNLIAKNEDSENEISNFLNNYNSINSSIDKKLVISPINKSKENRTKSCHPLCNCYECVNILTNKSINTRNGYGLSAIHITAMYGLPKILTFLLNIAEIDVEIVDDNNWNALHYAALRGHQNTLLLLLHAGININSSTYDNNTPLHLACINGHLNCVKALLYFADQMKIYLDVDAQNSLGNTPVHNAVKWGYTEITETLLEYNARIDITNKYGKLPINSAHNSKIGKLLMELKPIKRESLPGSPFLAPVNNTSNFSIISDEDLADEGTENAPITLESINQIDKIITAISNNDIKLACFYLDINNQSVFDSNNVNNIKNSESTCHPLCTCKDCYPTAANLVNNINNIVIKNTNTGNKITSVNKNRKININMINSDGYTPLHIAALNGNIELIELFISNGAIPSMKTIKTGETPLHLACKFNKYNALKLLLSKLIYNKNSKTINCVDVKDNFGDTILHLATKQNNCKLLELILLHQPNIKLRNFDGNRPIDIAKQSLSLNLVELLDNYENSNTNL